MNPNILNGLKRVQRKLLCFCWIFAFFIALGIICMITGDKPPTPFVAHAHLIFFVVSYFLYCLVKAFVCGVEDKEE